MIDLSNDRKSVETQIKGFIRKEQVVPFRVLQHYAHLLTVESGGSSGGGGGTTSPTTIRSGIDTSDDINTIIAELQSNNSISEEIRDYLLSNNAKGLIEFENAVGKSDNQIVSEDINSLELTLQNKSFEHFVRIRVGGNTTGNTKGLILPPLGIVSFEGYLSKQRVHASAVDQTVFLFAYRIVNYITASTLLEEGGPD